MVSAGFAYLSGFFGPEQGNILIIDISNPSVPREVGFFPAEANYRISGYASTKEFFYAVMSACPENEDCRFELRVFFAPLIIREPQMLGSLALPDNVMNFIGVVNGHAYVQRTKWGRELHFGPGNTQSQRMGPGYFVIGW